jgi:hypothetical protein
MIKKTKMFICFFLVCFLGSFYGCSQVSQLHSSDSEFKIRGGLAGKTEWSETLIFKRLSWHQQWNLWYDVLVSDFALSSPFANWLGSSERIALKGCTKIKLALFYSDEWSGAKLKNIRQEIRKVTNNRIKTSVFADALKSHPDFRATLFRTYQMEFWCLDAQSPKEITFQFPGFKEQSLSL